MNNKATKRKESEDYLEKKIKPILNSLVESIVDDKPDNMVSFNT